MSNTALRWVNRKEKPSEIMKLYPIRVFLGDKYVYDQSFHDEVGWQEHHLTEFDYLDEQAVPEQDELVDALGLALNYLNSGISINPHSGIHNSIEKALSDYKKVKP